MWIPKKGSTKGRGVSRARLDSGAKLTLMATFMVNGGGPTSSGGLALAAFGSRFLLTHGFVTLTPKLSEHFDSILLDRSTTTGRFS